MARVSVVIPTFNRSERLRQTLEAVARQRGEFEAIVVDDGSRDDEAAAVRAAVTAAGDRFTLIRTANRGPAAARNTGVAAAAGELVAFLDDDCAPGDDWLRKLTAAFDDEPRLGAVGGRVLPAPPSNWVSRFLAATEYSSGVQEVFENAATANACYRRAAIDDVGGFDEGFTRPGGDDPDLSARTRRAGYELRFVADAVVYHAELETLSDFLGHMFGRGLGEARLALKYGRRARVILRVVALPLFLGRVGLGAWRRTAGKGAAPVRVAWVVLDALGQAAFVAGSAVGLLRGS